MKWVYVFIGFIMFILCLWLGEYVATISYGVWPFPPIYPWVWLQPIFRVLGVVLLIVCVLMGVMKSGGAQNIDK